MQPRDLLGRSVLGDGLSSLTNGVLSQFSGQQQPDSGLNLPAGDGGTLVVVCKAGSLSCNAFKNVIHERVHDRHGLGGDTSVRVDLLEHLVDVDAVALLPPALLLLITLGDRLLGLTGLLGSLSGSFGWHDVNRTYGTKDEAPHSLFPFIVRRACQPPRTGPRLLAHLRSVPHASRRNLTQSTGAAYKS